MDKAARSPGLRLALADGSTVRTRILRPDDRDRLQAFYERLSDLSKYRRFFSCPARLPDAWADVLLTADDHHEFGLVAVPDSASHHIIALAQYWMSAARTSAEVGLVVADEWQ